MNLPAWFDEMLELVRAEIDRRSEAECENRPSLISERESIHRKIAGWKQSLADPNLNPDIRRELELEWTTATERDRELERSLTTLDSRESVTSRLVDESMVLQRLSRLAEVLAENNPTRGNLELSLHVEKITGYVDGKVELRTCKLGALPDVIKALLPLSMEEQSDSPGTGIQEASPKRRPKGLRRRSALRVVDDDSTGHGAESVTDFAADSHRFGSLGEEFFWVDTFQVPARVSWAQENALAVLERFEQLQRETGKRPSLNQIAREFGKSRPTIKTALEGMNKAEDREKTPRKFTSPLSAADRAKIVELYCTNELSRKEIADRFGIHRNTVTNILNEEFDKSGQIRPDGRRQRWIRLRNEKSAS